MTIAFIGMETSGTMRRAMQAHGIETYSGDFLPAQDGGEVAAFDHATGLTLGRHLVGDIFDTLDNLYATDLWPQIGVFHPTCTYLTNSAAWAYGDADFERYPGVGYHQKVKPGTLTGAARRAARADAVEDVFRIRTLKMSVKVIENPIGHLSSQIGPATQIVHPYQFGDDASKGTCLWVYEDGELLPPHEWLTLDPARYVEPTLRANGRRYWANQTDTGQNRLSPSDDRWSKRSDTYPGIAAALAEKLASYA